MTPALQQKDNRRDLYGAVGGGTSREETRFERSVAVGGAQVENQITEIAVDGELRLKRPAEKKRSLSLTDRTLPHDASKDAGI